MNVEPHTDREKKLAASCASAVASLAGSTAWEAAFLLSMYYIQSCKDGAMLGESKTLDGALEIARAALPNLNGYDTYISENSHGYSQIVCFSDGIISKPDNNVQYEAGYAYACGYRD